MDYEFGKKLYELRERSGLTQKKAAAKLGVTDKAVSKWETGTAKPGVEMIRKISALYNISVEKLLEILEEKKHPKIVKIVLTGGPCSGKTTAMSWIENAMTERGYKVIFVPEAATELINAGLNKQSFESVVDFQKNIMSLQIEKEKIYEEAAKRLNTEKVLIVCDRGTMDSKAYLSSIDFNILLDDLKLDEVELRDRYSGVFHLETSAKLGDEYYTLENNKARSETVEEARRLDDKIIESWVGHPHLRVIKNNKDFNEKMKDLIKEITSMLGEPAPYEIERKFLIDMPNLKRLEENPYCKKVEIIQTYLKSSNGHEIRVRQRGEKGSYIYYITEKVPVTNMKRIEKERLITEKEYLELLMRADTHSHQIRKNRYFLMQDGICYEIDIYPFWKDRAIMEVELTNEKDEIKMPSFIKLIREVTDEDEYKNRNLAKMENPGELEIEKEKTKVLMKH